MPIRVPVVQTGLEASIQVAAKKAGKAMKIDMGAGAKSIEGLSQPLGRITGKADQFTKSMEAANARVLAFGASVGVLSAVTRGFQELVKTTIEVEKQLTSINSILGGTTAQLQKFKKEIFDVARNTEQSFDTVSQAALELSRQGLKAEEVTSRLNDSLILARLSGLGASEAVFGLTAAINSFRKEGISSAEVLNKLSAAAVSAAVSEKDLIEGIKRSGSVATQAGVSFNELVGVITAVQEKTARGGAVIGNSFKTIFTRIQSLEKLKTMQQLGVQVEDASGQVLGATKLIQNLAQTLEKLPDATRLQIAENLVGKFQIAPFLAILEDYNSATSTAIRVTEVSANATREAYERNVALSKTLSHAISETVLNVKELADTLGKIGVTDNLRGILDFFGNLVGNINKVLEGDTLGSKFAKGIVKGIGGVLSGPGLAIFGAIIAKLTLDLAKFGIGSLKTFFGLNKAARDQVTLQGQIASTLLGNKGIQAQIMAIENSTLSIEQKRAAQTRFFTTALNEQLLVMTRMQAIAARVAPGVMAGTRGVRGRGAGGYIPNFNATMGYGSEQADINRGVGGAPKGARPVTMPNFNFGGGQRGTMVANSSEYVVPHFGGKSGSAIFNQNMVAEMGLPAGARKIGAAGGYIPNFQAKKGGKGTINADQYFYLVPDFKGRKGARLREGAVSTVEGQKITGGRTYGLDPKQVKVVSDKDENLLQKNITNSLVRHTARYVTKLEPLGRKVTAKQVRHGFETTRGAKGALHGAIGSAFEVGITQALDYRAAIREKGGDFDVRRGTNLDKIRKLFGISPALHTGDFKVNTDLPNVRSFYKKVIKESRAGKFGATEKRQNAIALARQELRNDPKYKGLFRADGSDRVGQGTTISNLVQKRLPTFQARFAGGYIPNYADPLQEAIGREKAAGLPLSQIRINQDSSLRGAGNPMGLAVTNMRDEPTGAIPRGAGGFIPNYSWNTGVTKAQVTGAGHQWNKAGVSAFKAGGGGVGAPPQRDLLGPIFAVTAAMSALQGATSGAESGLAKFTNITAKALSGMATAVFAGTAIKGFATDMKDSNSKLTRGFGKVLGPLSTFGMALGIGAAVYKGVAEAVNEYSGANRNATIALGQLKDASEKLSIKFGMMSHERQAEITEEAKAIVSKGRTTVMRRRGHRDESAALAIKNNSQGFQEFLRTVPEDQRDKVRKEMEADPDKYATQSFQAERRIFGTPGTDAEKKLRSTFEDATQGFISLGATAEEIDAILDLLGQDLSRDPFALANFLKERSKLNKKIAKDTENFNSLLDKLTDKQLQELEKGLKGKSTGLGFLPPAFQHQIALGAARTQTGLPTAGGMLPSERKESLIEEEEKERDQKRKGAMAESTRLEVDAQKKILTALLEVKRIRLTNTNEIKSQISAAKILGNLTNEEVRSLERKEFVEAQANKRLTDRVNLIKEQVKATGGLSIDENERNLLAERFGALKREDIENADQLKDIIRQTIVLDAKREIAADKLVKSLFDILTAEDKVADEQDALNLLFKDGEISTANMADNLARAAGILNAQAKSGVFQAGLENRRDTLEDQRTIRGINRDLIGASPQDRARLEAQRGGLQAGIAGRGVVEQERFRLSRDFALELAAKEGAAFMDGAIQQVKEATTTEQLSQIIEQKKKGTKAQQELFKSPEGIDFKNALEEQTFKLEELGDAAAAAGEELGTFDKAKLESALGLSQAEIMGVGVAEARRLDEATRGSLGKNLTPDNARRLSTLQRSVGQRLAESPDFNPIYQADTLASTITTAALNFKNTMSDAMVDSIIQGGNLGDILRSAATNFFTMLSKAYMQNAVDRIVGSGGGLLSALFGKKNSGGLITGGSGARDDVPTLLTGGEFVVRKGAVEKYGTQFFEGLNTGRVGQMQRGGLFTPGTYGQGSITGSQNLLDFATQSYTGGQFDQISEGAGFGSASLEPQSAALTMFGRRNSPLFQREQQSKQEAFGLYTRQIQYEEQIKEQNKEDRKQFRNSILAAAGSAALSYGIDHLSETLDKKPDANIEPPAARRASETFTPTPSNTPTPRNRSTQANISVPSPSPSPNPLPSQQAGPNQIEQPFRGGFISRGLNKAIILLQNGSNALLDASFRIQSIVGGNQLRNQADSNPLLPPLPRAAGGYISPTAGVDTVPSMLSGGEFVMNAAATQRMGRGNLAALNSGGGGEGSDGAIVAAINNLGDELGRNGESVINITVNSDGTQTQDSNGGEEDQNLAARLGDSVRQIIAEEQRLGGSLRRV